MGDEKNFVTASGLLESLKKAFGEWSEDNAPQFAAAIAFYTILSLGPLLIFSISIAAIAFEAEAARGEIHESVRQYIGSGAAEMTQEIIQNASERKGGLFVNLLGLLLLAFGASRIFQQLKIALNQILDVDTQEKGGIGKMVMDRIFAILAVVGVGIFLMASILVNAVLGRVGDALPIPGGSLLWQAVSQTVSLALIAVVFALILRYLPDLRTPWKFVWEGAIFTAALFTIGQIVIGLYLSKSDPGSSFGAAGPVIVVIVWIYYTTVIFFFGAEFMEVRCRADDAFTEERARHRVERGADRRIAATQPGATLAAHSASRGPDAAKARSGGSGSGVVKVAGSAAAGGCLGLVAGLATALFGLLLASAKLVGKLLPKR